MIEARRALETEILEMVVHKATDGELESLGRVEKILMKIAL